LRRETHGEWGHAFADMAAATADYQEVGQQQPKLSNPEQVLIRISQ
jgi:hypothetical protein